jgi:outer membrane protein TolC
MRSSIATLAVTMAALSMTSLLTLAVPASAQRATPARSGPYPDPASEEPLRPVEGRPLSISEAIALGLTNNLGVEVNRYAPYISQLEADASWGAYDPFFSSDYTYTSQVPPREVSNDFNPGSSDSSGRGSLEALVPYVGARLGVNFEGGKSDNPMIFNPLDPTYRSSLGITGTLPLMKGLIWSQEWTQVKTSQLAYGVSLDTFTTSVMDTVQTIINLYWNLVAAKEQERVAEKTLESNRALLDQTKIQYEVGVVSKVAVVQAEAGVADAEFNLIVSKNTYRNLQDDLIAAVLGDHLRADTTLIFFLTDNPEFHSVEPVDLNTAVATAFAKRPELAAAQKTIEQGEFQLRFAKNQRLPQFDVVGGVDTIGASGPLNPQSLPGTTPTLNQITAGDNWTDSVDNWFGGSYDARVTARFTIPIPNTTARKNVTKSRIELRRANSQVTRLKQDIIVQVRKAARGQLAAAQGVEAAERRRIAAAEQLRAEQIRLEHGESTPFDVLQRQTDLVSAESQKIDALRAFRTSQVTLERQQGTILDARNVVLSSVGELK